uniref:hypothetical protein n=1 Tax=Mesorhizobium abyssinicae TaxID=1209958 RepID=UPI00387DC7E2
MDAGADYLLAVKANQKPGLTGEIKRFFDDPVTSGVRVEDVDWARRHGVQRTYVHHVAKFSRFFANRRFGRDTNRCAPIRYNVAAVRPF